MKNIIYLAVFLWAVTANASESVSWNQSKALPISKVMEVISAHKASELKEYTEVYFDLKVNIQNGQVKQSVVRVYYFPDSASLQNYGTDVIRFTKGIENLSLLRIASISPDGKITEFSHGDLKINELIKTHFLKDKYKKLLIITPSKPDSDLFDYENVIYYGLGNGVQNINRENINRLMNK